MKSPFLEFYKADAVDALLDINPEWDRDEVDELVEKEMKKSFSNPSVVIDNNFKRETQSSTLLTIMDWAIDKEPLIAGNGTFYKNQHQAANPIANMLDGMLKRRKALKKEMFKVEDKTSQRYKDLDLAQQIQKINANSYYGASGMPASAFFSKWSGGCTTGSCQSVISTCYSTFEAFIADNFVFMDINECFNWLKVVREQIALDPETVSWLKPHTKRDVYEKLKGMFFHWKDSYEDMLWKYVCNLDDNEINRIYYRNRLQEFTEDHKYVIELNKRILDNVNIYPVLPKKLAEKKDGSWEKEIPQEFVGKFLSGLDYNSFACKEAFMDPNDIPKSVEKEVKELGALYMKYVYTQYLVFDRIYRLKNFGRKTVMVIDTDSNILALDEWIEFVFDKFAKLSDKPKENIEFILINTITYTLTQVVTDILLFYGKCSNIPEEFRGRYAMKNEFFMRRLIISEVKKRYMSLFKLREGNLLNPPKTDIKGFDFKKSATSDVCEEIFTRLSEDYLLKAEEIDVKGLRNELMELQKTIMEDIQCGNLTYLPNANAKELAAYAEPGSEQSVRGVIAWNLLNPESQIELPSKVKLLKLMIFKEEDIEPLRRTNPDIHKIIMDEIFNDTSGIFVTKSVKNGKVNIKSKGMQVLAIPNNASIPDWVKPYIDYTNVIGSIMAPYKSVTDLLKINCVSTGYKKNGINRETESFTNIITF